MSHWHSPCPDCGFVLFSPVARLDVSDAGLYDDGRYPGRLIVSSRIHVEHLDEADPGHLSDFVSDVARACAALRTLPGVLRANMAVLGNREPHLHAHLIPRRAGEPNPGKAPWDDAPPHRRLDPDRKQQLLHDLAQRLAD